MEVDSRFTTVSVVVTTLDRLWDIDRFFESLAGQTRLPDQLVVVDAGAIEPTREAMHQRLGGTDLELVHLCSERGTSLQRNRALDVVKSDIIMFFDDDVVLEPQYIEEILACFESSRMPPVGGVQGTLLEPPTLSPLRTWLYHFFCFSHEASGREPVLYSNGDVRHCADPSRVIETPALQGCRMAFRREVFDSDRFIQYLPGYCRGEDVDLSYRVSRSWTLLQTPGALLSHRFSPVNRLSGEAIVYRRIRARIRFFHHYGRLSGLPALLWSLVGYCGYQVLRALMTAQPRVLRGLARGLVGGLVDPGIRSSTPGDSKVSRVPGDPRRLE